MEPPARFVRFVVPVLHEDTACATGMFQVRDACRLRRALPVVDRRVDRAIEWFNRNLPVPPVVKERRDVLCWFRREPDEPTRPDAHEPLRRAFLLAGYLRSRGIGVETLQTTTPGDVVYEDRWQIVAAPFVATPTGRARRR